MKKNRITLRHKQLAKLIESRIIAQLYGVTPKLSDKLLEAPTVRKNKPIKSNKFDTMSLYYDGIYYFPSDIKKSNRQEGKPFEIQAVYYRGKWYQDTFYITNEFKEFLLNAL